MASLTLELTDNQLQRVLLALTPQPENDTKTPDVTVSYDNGIDFEKPDVPTPAGSIVEHKEVKGPSLFPVAEKPNIFQTNPLPVEGNVQTPNGEAIAATVGNSVLGQTSDIDVALDEAGRPHDDRIHGSGKVFMKSGARAGQWKLQRGVDVALVTLVENELDGVAATPGAINYSELYGQLVEGFTTGKIGLFDMQNALTELGLGAISEASGNNVIIQKLADALL